MNDTTLLGPWIRRFLIEHVIGERNLSRQTQLSYRDMLRLLLPFIAEQCQQSLDRLTVEQISATRVQAFLRHLEDERRCTISTRNQRLAAIRALAGFVAEHSPEHIDWCAQIRLIPFKKTSQPAITYLDKPEMDALLAAPDDHTAQGRREQALLLFLYNSGARVSEAVQLKIGDIDWHAQCVRIVGKGNKQRRCPLWASSIRRLPAPSAFGSSIRNTPWR